MGRTSQALDGRYLQKENITNIKTELSGISPLFLELQPRPTAEDNGVKYPT